MAAEGKTARLETPDVRARLVVLTMAGILALLAAIGFGLQWAYPDHVGATSAERHDFPAPGVRPDEHAQRLALEAAQRAALNGGGGRMPLEAAMRAIAAKGPHAFDPIGAPP